MKRRGLLVLAGVAALPSIVRAQPGSLPRIVRLMLHYYAPEDHRPQHVYLGRARALRSDLEAAQ